MPSYCLSKKIKYYKIGEMTVDRNYEKILFFSLLELPTLFLKYE